MQPLILHMPLQSCLGLVFRPASLSPAQGRCCSQLLLQRSQRSARLLPTVVTNVPMRLLLAAAAALAVHPRAAAASDITLKLDLSVFGLDMSDASGGGGGGTAGLLGNMMDTDGNIFVIEDGAPNNFLLALTTLVPIPESYENTTLDEVTMVYSSPTELAFNLDVSLTDTEAHTQAGWIAANVTEVSVLTAGRLPATPIDFMVSLSVSTHRNPHHNLMSWLTDACGRSSGGVAARAVARSAS